MRRVVFSGLTLAVALGLTGCGAGEYFPDKSKDYQLSTEIPPLELPADLSTTSTINAKPIESALTQNQAVFNSQADSVSVEPLIEKQSEPVNSNPVIYLELVNFTSGASRIRVEDSMAKVWRLVGKALSRNSIEITERNEADRVYWVQYDPHFASVQDGSLWDEVVFIFGDDPAQEKEYHIRAIENGGLIEVFVLDRHEKPISSAKSNGYQLLKLIYASFKEDYATIQTD
jgi:outer membrane protein assembly factor BamC